jgi:hypothetical protein
VIYVKYTSKLLLLMACIILLSSVASAVVPDDTCTLDILEIGVFDDENCDGV